MSGGSALLTLKEGDVTKMLIAKTHLGSTNCNFQMTDYVYKRRSDGVHIMNLRRTWEKLMMAARAIVCIDQTCDIYAIASRPSGQRGVLKFASYVGATPIAGRFTPGAFTNQAQKAFREPRILIVSDPQADHQSVTEASYVNIPVIAFCNTDTPVRYIDIVIPCNTKSNHTVGLMWWMLAREVLRLRGELSRDTEWDVMPDLFFYREPEELEKEETIKKDAVLFPKTEIKSDTQPPVAAISAFEETWAEGDVKMAWTDEPPQIPPQLMAQNPFELPSYAAPNLPSEVLSQFPTESSISNQLLSQLPSQFVSQLSSQVPVENTPAITSKPPITLEITDETQKTRAEPQKSTAWASIVDNWNI